MAFLRVTKTDGIAEVVFSRGKVNAINEPVVEEFVSGFQALAEDLDTKAVLLSGEGKFFSFGFDIPEFLGYSKEAFTAYLLKFTDLYTYLFNYPKPIVAALNGHTIAAGCMLALACDARIMASGKGKISLNEVTFGSSLFAGSVRMLKFVVGENKAQRICCEGAMFSAEEAQGLGLVDRAVPEQDLLPAARETAIRLAGKDARAYASIKRLLRTPVTAEMKAGEKASVHEFVDIWYSPSTWKNLQEIKIHA